MDNALIIMYAIKVSVALFLFYGLYLLCLRADTFLKLRRFYFLFAIVFSLAYPLFNIELPANEAQQTPIELPVYFSQLEVEIFDVQVAEPEPAPVNYKDYTVPTLLLASLLGSAILVVSFATQLFSIFRLIRKNSKKTAQAFRIIEAGEKDITAFSFFGWIFINVNKIDTGEFSEILAHEKVHVHQFHSVDVLIAETLCICFWWNPITWLMKRAIKTNLEYLADQGALNMGVDTKNYQYALLQLSISTTGIPIINNFNVSQLKKRIIMMNKHKSSLLLSAKYLLAIPAGMLLIFGNAVQASPALANLPSEIVSTILAPEPEAPAVENNQVQSVEETIAPPQPVQPVQAELQDTLPVAPPTSKPYVSVEVMPQFSGGMSELSKFIQKNLRYPRQAAKDSIQGSVIVRFVVTKDGSIADTTVVRGVSPELDAEAKRVIGLMPKWIPGKQNGESVDVYFTMPIVFKLNLGPAVDDKPDAEGIYRSVEVMPQFPGGMPNLLRFINTSLINFKGDIKESALVRFVVKKDGSITDAKIMQGGSPELNAEVLRVIGSMPKWIPGEQNGEPVDVYYTMPIGTIDVMPQYPGGTKELLKFINDNRIPATGDAEAGGNVTVSFVVTKNGSITDAKIEKGASPEANAEALRIVSLMPRWIPGKQNGNPVDARYRLGFPVVEIEAAKYPGGWKELGEFIYNNLKYPEQALKAKIEGDVTVRFTITTDGSISGAKVVKGVSPELDAEALRIVGLLPKFTPGIQNGKPKESNFTLPISFRLPK
ncbi:TonB family protein [Viscerimonas tarda]